PRSPSPSRRSRRSAGSSAARILKGSRFTPALLALTILPGPAFAEGLSGSVTSAEEGRMEGVLVSARNTGTPVTVTVVSDREGRLDWARERLAGGRYELATGAVGYELASPASVELGTSGTSLELKLRRARDLAAQLSNTEWLMSMPGTAEQKRPLIECMSCH